MQLKRTLAGDLEIKQKTFHLMSMSRDFWDIMTDMALVGSGPHGWNASGCLSTTDGASSAVSASC